MDPVIVFFAKYLFLAVPLLVGLAWLQAGRRQKKQIVLAIFTALVIALILDKIAAKLYYDPRPFVTQNVKPLVAHTADNGFPSEHTLFSAALAATLVLYRKKLGWIALSIALAVGIARVAALVHSPIDIAAALVIGSIAGYSGFRLAGRYLYSARSPKISAKPPANRR